MLSLRAFGDVSYPMSVWLVSHRKFKQYVVVDEVLQGLSCVPSEQLHTPFMRLTMEKAI